MKRSADSESSVLDLYTVQRSAAQDRVRTCCGCKCVSKSVGSLGNLSSQPGGEERAQERAFFSSLDGSKSSVAQMATPKKKKKKMGQNAARDAAMQATAAESWQPTATHARPR